MPHPRTHSSSCPCPRPRGPHSLCDPPLVSSAASCQWRWEQQQEELAAPTCSHYARNSAEHSTAPWQMEACHRTKGSQGVQSPPVHPKVAMGSALLMGAPQTNPQSPRHPRWLSAVSRPNPSFRKGMWGLTHEWRSGLGATCGQQGQVANQPVHFAHGNATGLQNVLTLTEAHGGRSTLSATRTQSPPDTGAHAPLGKAACPHLPRWWSWGPCQPAPSPPSPRLAAQR